MATQRPRVPVQGGSGSSPKGRVLCGDVHDSSRFGADQVTDGGGV